MFKKFLKEISFMKITTLKLVQVEFNTNILDSENFSKAQKDSKILKYFLNLLTKRRTLH